MLQPLALTTLLACPILQDAPAPVPIPGPEDPISKLQLSDENVAGRGAPEFGAVHWERRLDFGLKRSFSNGRPVLLLFQEVPG